MTASPDSVATKPTPPRLYKHLDLITASFVAVLIISNVAAVKTVSFGALVFDGGTLLFPLAYIFGDVLTEVYGYARSRRVIWIGFFWLALAAIIFALVGYLPAAGFWTDQTAWDKILGQTPRIVIGSLAAYFVGVITNSFILAKLKLITQGRWLWLRTIGSTLGGELIDSAVFVVIAFGGVFTNAEVVQLIVSNYLFKCAVEVLFTPVTYRIVAFLKRAENEDYYDRETNFNPFTVRI